MSIYTLSNLSDEFRDLITAYTGYTAKNPDPGSEFDLNTRDIRHLPKDELVAELVGRGYDGYFLIETNAIICHVFFQKHKHDWRVLSVYTNPKYRKQNRASAMIQEFLSRAFACPSNKGVQLGAGGNEVMTHIWKKVLKGKLKPFDDFKCTKTSRVGRIKFIR